MGRLDHKRILITGANRGVGRALAEACLAEGAHCLLTVRTPQLANDLGGALGSHGHIEIDICDIGVDGAPAALAQGLRERHAHVDALVNNAAIFLDEDRAASADAVSLATLRRTFDVNVFGTIAMCQAISPLLGRGGRIVNVTSTLGQLDGGLEATMTAYSMSKTALNAYTSSLAAALRPRGIRVDCVHPGWVQTAMGGAAAPRPPAEAARHLVDLLAQDGLEPSGRFWKDGKIVPW